MIIGCGVGPREQPGHGPPTLVETRSFTLTEPASLYLGQPGTFAFDRQGRLLVIDRFARRVIRFDRRHQPDLVYGRAGRGPGEFLGPHLVLPDYECPDCRQEHLRMRERLEKLDGVALVVHHVPLPIHFAAAGAARSAMCAGDQGFFAQMHERLNTESDWLVDTNWVRLAQAIEVPDLPRFAACIGSPSTKERLERQKQLGSSLGVTGTPTFFVAGKKHYGIMSDSVFAALIREDKGASKGSASRHRAEVQ